ncbi:chitin synthase chs-2-like isoform X2 [Hyperolius riggenbachi]
MPHFNILTNTMILSSIYGCPSLLQIVYGFRKRKWKWILSGVSFLSLLVGHLLFFLSYSFNKDAQHILYYVGVLVATIFVSVNWYENFVRKKNVCPTKSEQDERNILCVYGSILRILVTAIVVFSYIGVKGVDWSTIFSVEEDYRGAYLLIVLFGIQSVSSALFHWFGVVSCKMRKIKMCFYIPSILTTLTVALAIIGIFISKYKETRRSTASDMPSFCQSLHFMDNATISTNLIIEIAQNLCQTIMLTNTTSAILMAASNLFWFVGFVFATLHVLRLKVQRIERTTKLFSRRMYEAAFIDQSMLLNTRSKLSRSTAGWKENKSPDKVMVYLCATMWHETFSEMRKILTSMFRLDKFKPSMQDETFSFEAHIYFDDAFVDDSQSQQGEKKRYVNSYVECLVHAIEEVYRGFTMNKKDIFVHTPTSAENITQSILSTPYGGRLFYKLPCGNLLYVHLKDKQRIRHKKRWSQIMYLYYLLGWKLHHKYAKAAEKADPTDTEVLENIKADLEKEKSNTYILALDGDTDFQPSAVMLLVDRLRMYPRVGAACGRIHPTGIGPLVWYQKFEYAVGHWLQKSSEHVFGCVLCSPGCFSLFRGSALMDDNVLKKYSTKAQEASEYVQYDQGEDRWLCTLLLQQGWRVEYNAASDAYTNAPQEFQEFYNQRRRWGPSTMANTLDLLYTGNETSKKNPSISNLYIIYQILTMASSILSPATVCLMIAGSFSFMFHLDANTSIIVAIIPPACYVGVCYLAKSSIQITVAAWLSVAYAFMMTATFLCIIGDIVKQQTFMTPSGLFLIVMILIYTVTALLHPQEFFLLIYGLVYIICVPSGYLLLTIYSLVNMHVVSWGTRETATPKPDSQPKKRNRVRYQKTCKCICWDIEVVVHDNKCEKEEESTIVGKDGEQAADFPSAQTENGPVEMNITYEESWIFQLQQKTNHNILKEEQLEVEEIPFWQGAIKSYLEPLNEDKKKQDEIQRELKSMRNKVIFIYFMINLLWIVATFFLQIIGSYVSIVLPKIYVNGTVSSTEKLYVEPIGFMFLLSFAGLLILQFGALLYHRIYTAIHYVAYKETK